MPCWLTICFLLKNCFTSCFFVFVFTRVRFKIVSCILSFAILEMNTQLNLNGAGESWIKRHIENNILLISKIKGKTKKLETFLHIEHGY